MGYSLERIATLDEMFDEGILFPGARIIEFGAQEINGTTAQIKEAAQTLVNKLQLDVKVPDFKTNGTHEVYELIGIEHAAIDVNSLYNSTIFDLNTDIVSEKEKGKYDWVNNEGTTEHVCNQINAQRAAHDFCKVDGYMSHSVPVIGWVDHGLVNCTPKFWATLAGENRYHSKKLHFQVTDQPHKLPEWYDKWERSEDFSYPDVWLHMIYQKTIDEPFVIPVDHLENDGERAVARMLQANAQNYQNKPKSGWKKWFGN